MPDLIRTRRHLPHMLRQPVVRIREDEYVRSLFRLWVRGHDGFGILSRESNEEYRWTLDENTV